MMDKDCPIPEPFKAVIGSILFLTLIFFAGFIGRFIFAPLMPSIVQDLGLTAGQAGSIFLTGSIGVFIGSVTSGFLSSKITHRGALIVALFVTGIALLLSVFINSLFTVKCLVLVIGIAAGFNLPSNMATITSIVDSKDWGKALAVQQMAPPLSLILGPLFCVFLLQWFSWRTPLVFLGVMSIVVGFALVRFGRFGAFPGDAPNISRIKSIFSLKSFWIMVILFAVGMGGQVGVYAMLPLFLVTEKGMNADTANTLLGLSQVSALFMTFIAGWITDKIGEKRAIAVFLAVSGIATIALGAASGTALKVIIFIQPALIVCYFPAGFAALSRIVQPDLRSIATAWTTPTAFFLGGGLFPAALGYMGEVYTFGTGIMLSGCIIAAGSILVIFLKLLDKIEAGC